MTHKLVPLEPTPEMIEAGDKAAARAWITGEKMAAAILKAGIEAYQDPTPESRMRGID